MRWAYRNGECRLRRATRWRWGRDVACFRVLQFSLRRLKSAHVSVGVLENQQVSSRTSNMQTGT